MNENHDERGRFAAKDGMGVSLKVGDKVMSPKGHWAGPKGTQVMDKSKSVAYIKGIKGNKVETIYGTKSAHTLFALRDGRPGQNTLVRPSSNAPEPIRVNGRYL